MYKRSFLLIPIFLSVVLIGCTHVKEYPQAKARRSTVSVGDLKGLSKVDIIQKFGQPLATSQSDVSESWYYAQPAEIWIWFEKNKVESWEIK